MQNSQNNTKYLQGQVIFKQGDGGDCAYIIEKGRVLVYLEKEAIETPLTILGEGEIFGEMSLIDNQNRSASARALDDCVLNIVTRQQLMERVYAADTVVRLLIRVLLKRLRINNSRMIDSDKKRAEYSAVQDSFVQEELNETKDALNKIRIENQIFDAFKNEEFLMHYQPIVKMDTAQICGCEALLRWNSPSLGMISPNAFIEVIENSSMVFQVGNWILDRSFKELAEIIKFAKNKDEFQMAINISGRQFISPNFIPQIEELRKKHQVDVKNIKLEVTERVMMDGVLGMETLSSCRDLGYSISIDDFGTGFSCLQYLAKMPVSNVKIDRSFVIKMLSDAKTYAIVSSIIYMAKSLNMSVVAEGIETEVERKALQQMGAEYGQGYLFSRPVEKLKLISLVQ
jgi:EAL domain-containing protein (putative c-di-GMP-specific phosphodiesterase class I)